MLSTALPAGRLRHRVKIVQPTLAQDSAGGVDLNDVLLLAEVYGEVAALTGRELYAAQQKVSEVTHKVTIRWRAGVRAKQLVWFTGPEAGFVRVFQIMFVENYDERNKMLVLLCIERDDSEREGPGHVSGNVDLTALPGMKVRIDEFTGDGTTTAFVLSFTPIGKVGWYRNGFLDADGAALTGQTMNASPAPSPGDRLVALYIG